ncbi:MAG: UDP-N-acetylmuramoyl-L-alanyl-D-glutamate--2,6-diaminopimelate ligase, partial [Melioribacteraceae bacterium]|nr:UDP-N-acetylmuramoyl-L-alanyl-D-glutamate--2,6-diaminopimelate ligase [Melioribacteraceae bacterium]
MKLNRLLDNLRVIQVVGTPELKEIESITNNSIEVKDNSVFVAVKGFKTDGHKYIVDAIDKGAIAVVLEDESNIPNDIFKHSGVVKILVEDS